MSATLGSLDPGAASRCAFRTVLEHDEVSPAQRGPGRDLAVARRVDAANLHRAAVTAALLAAHPGRSVDAANDEAATVAAIGSGHVDLVVRPRLPRDGVGRRHGSPSILVMDRGTEPTCWRPVDVHNHFLTAEGSLEFAASSIGAPWPQDAVAQPGRRLRKGGAWRRDLLRLAHFHRMLGALDVACDRPAIAGVIDRGSTLWWLDLDERIDQRGAALDQHDVRLAERIALLDATLARNADPALPRPGRPWWHRECEDCPFAQDCHDALAARDDVSLIRYTDATEQEVLKDHGIATRRQLAALDLAEVARGRATPDEPSDQSTSLAVQVGRRVKDADRLVRRARVDVAGTLLRIVPAELIDARRADVEIDFDMESYDNATYLWGTLVTARAPAPGVTEGYRAFVEWGPLSASAEGALFASFFAWLSATIGAARDAGLTVGLYCFWEHAELGQMRRAMGSGVAGLPSPDALEDVLGSLLVDLHHVIASQIQTAGPAGLKAVATAAGFEWRDGDPSGEASMAWYEDAVGADSVASDAARRRLLEYNEDDCLATRALRDWLEGPARALPDIEEARPGGP